MMAYVTTKSLQSQSVLQLPALFMIMQLPPIDTPTSGVTLVRAVLNTMDRSPPMLVRLSRPVMAVSPPLPDIVSEPPMEVKESRPTTSVKALDSLISRWPSMYVKPSRPTRLVRALLSSMINDPLRVVRLPRAASVVSFLLVSRLKSPTTVVNAARPSSDSSSALLVTAKLPTQVSASKPAKLVRLGLRVISSSPVMAVTVAKAASKAASALHAAGLWLLRDTLPVMERRPVTVLVMAGC